MPRFFHSGSPPVTCDHACHRRRGSLGGEDFALAQGSPVYAPFSGTYRFHRAGTGGWTITGVPSDSRLRGYFAQVMHLSASAGLVLNGSSRYYPEDALIAASGGRPGHPGAGSSTGPHTHEHGVIHGVRVAMSAFIAAIAAKITPAGGSGTPISPARRRRSEMDAYVIGRVDDGDVGELSLCHPTLVGPTPIEQGYIVVRPGRASDGSRISARDAIVAAARAYGLGAGIATTNSGDRDTYLAGQQLARDVRAQYLRDRDELAAAIAKALPAGGGAPIPSPTSGVLELRGTITPKEQS